MKAVVLAAGEGTRLRPLTHVRPKPMLPAANRPILEYAIQAAAQASIDELVLVVGYNRERIQNYFGDGTDWGVEITYAIQAKQLGTGHAVLQAEPYVDEEFVVLNGDRVIDSDIIARLAGESVRPPTIAVRHSETPSRYGVVSLAGDRVQGIVEKPPEHATTTDIINAGVYRLSTSVFDAIRETESMSELMLTETLDRLASDGRVRAVRYDGQWLDVSHLWDLLSVNADAVDPRTTDTHPTATVHDSAVSTGPVDLAADVRIHPHSTVMSGSSLGENVEIGANAVVANSVVLPDTRIGDGTVLRDCVVGSNSIVGPNVTVSGGRADVVVAGELHQSVRLGGVVGDNATLRGGVTVTPGSVIGNDATVHEGAMIDGRIENGATVRRG